MPLVCHSGQTPGLRSAPKLLSALKLAGFVKVTVLSEQELDSGRDESATWAVADTTVSLQPEDLRNVVITEVSEVALDTVQCVCNILFESEEARLLVSAGW